MRGVLDPKRHYKANDSKKLPKYFQVLHSVHQFFFLSSFATVRLGQLSTAQQTITPIAPPRSSGSRFDPDNVICSLTTHQTLADELLQDAKFRKYNKSKFLALQASTARGGRFHERKDKLKRGKKGKKHK